MTADDLRTAISDAPAELAAWLQTQHSIESAWANCDRADWLLWLARRRPLDESQQRRLVGAAALAIRACDPTRSPPRELRLAVAWSSLDLDDPDPTGFRATILSLVIAGTIGVALELWLFFRPTNPIRGLRRELYSIPTFLILALIIRLVAQPALRRRWAAEVRGYSLQRAERSVFPSLVKAVAHADARQRSSMANTFRKRIEWSR
jgi:hypothetical protein